MNSIILIICGALISVAAILIVLRVEKGPSMLDRIIALDVLVAVIIAFIAIYSAYSRRTDLVPVLVVLAMVGFVGSVTLARFVAVEPEEKDRILSPEERARVEAINAARADIVANRKVSQTEPDEDAADAIRPRGRQKGKSS